MPQAIASIPSPSGGDALLAGRRSQGPGQRTRAGEVTPQDEGTAAERSLTGERLSERERRELDELRSTDRRVRQHEEAHRAAAGPLFRGGPTYELRTGPDGKMYAVAGSVRIDTSPGRTPEETVRKAAAIRRAALAPMDPSSTDRAIAAKASRMESAARQAMVRTQLRALRGDDVAAPPPPSSVGSTAGDLTPGVEGAGQDASGTGRDAPEGASQNARPSRGGGLGELVSGRLELQELGGEVFAPVARLASDAAPSQADRRKGAAIDELA